MKGKKKKQEQNIIDFQGEITLEYSHNKEKDVSQSHFKSKCIA